MTVLITEKYIKFYGANNRILELDYATFIKKIKNKKNLRFLREVSNKNRTNIIYTSVNQYHFLKGFVQNTIQELNN